MQLTLRSQLIAGAAALGVAAAVVVPSAPSDLSTARVSDVVNLVAFDNPIAVLLGTAEDVVFNIFDPLAVPAPADLYWPDSFYTEDFSFLFAPGYWGTIPDFVNQFSKGGLSAVASNLSGYVSAAAYGLNSLIAGPTTAIWNTPFALVTAAGYLLAGQVDLALAELQTQILDPIVEAFNDIVDVTGYIVDNVISNAATVLSNTIPGLVSNVIGSVVAGTTYVFEDALATLGQVVTDLASLQLEDAWNGALDGFLGQNGTLGQIENLLVGIGIIQDVEYEEGVVPTVTIPSLRSDLTTASQRLGDLSFYGDGGIRNESFFVNVMGAAAVDPAAAVAPEVSAEVPAEAEVEVQAPAACPVKESAAADVARPVAGASATNSDSVISGDSVTGNDSDSAAGSAPAAADVKSPAVAADAEKADADGSAASAEKAAPSKGKAARGGRGGE